MVIADIPGLIEGAAHGAGLGQRFLRHVERTRVLVYVLDGSAAEPWKDLDTVRKEVALFSAELAQRPSLIAVNKLDLEAARKLKAKTRRKDGPEVVFVSALSGEGLPRLMQAVVTALAGAPAPPVPARARTTKLAARPSPDLVVEQRHGDSSCAASGSSAWSSGRTSTRKPALERFQSLLDKLGVSAALEAAGVKPGDTVRIAEAEFEYQP